jgi:GxxExxY protein
MEFDNLSNQVIGVALTVHSALGPGLFEEVYKVCLWHELIKAGLKVASEVPVPVVYGGIKLDIGYKADLIVEDLLILELKSVQQLAQVHKAQLLTYLKLARMELGLLLNFNTTHLRDGILRVINSLPPSRPSLLRVKNSSGFI